MAATGQNKYSQRLLGRGFIVCKNLDASIVNSHTVAEIEPFESSQMVNDQFKRRIRYVASGQAKIGASIEMSDRGIDSRTTVDRWRKQVTYTGILDASNPAEVEAKEERIGTAAQR